MENRCEYQGTSMVMADQLKIPKISLTYSCYHCDYSSTKKKLLANVRMGLKKVICLLNNSPFITKHTSGQTRRRLTDSQGHEGGGPRTRQKLEALFSNYCNSKIHTKTHIGEKPYRCSECNYSSAVKSKLTIHMSSHTGERPYCCKECDYSFARKEYLTKHMRIHTGEKPYYCVECNFSTALKDYLAKHMRVHLVNNISVAKSVSIP